MSDTLLRSSVNYELLELGLVYPAFYKSLPSNLRSALRNTSRSAQRNNTGLWPEAACLTGKIATIPDFATLQELVLWPKLFRRLTSYFTAGHIGLSNFLEWMEEPRFQKERNDFFLLPDGSVGNFTDIIEVHGDTLSVRYDSDDVTIIPDDGSPNDVDESQAKIKPIVRILSLMPAPVKGIKENICILNTTPFTVNLDGWTLSDLKDNTDNLVGNLVSGEIRQIEAGAITLNNSGDVIFLKNSQGEIIDQVKYYGSQAECKGRTIVVVRIGERSIAGH
jgi:hypothetical protein